MNMHKIFIFNACILMSFPNISAMQKDITQEDSSFSEEELYSEEDLQALKEIKQNEIIKLKKNVIDVIDSDIKSIKKQIEIIETQDKKIENFLLRYAEQNLMKPRAASPDIEGQGERRQTRKVELMNELNEKITQKNNFQKELVDITIEKLTQLSLKELKDLYKKLNKKLFNKYAEEDESDFSEDEIKISLSKNSKKAQSAEELITFVRAEDELNTIKERKISEQDLLTKEIYGTTLSLPKSSNNIAEDRSEEISDITAPLPIESNIEENNSPRKIKFTPNGRFFTMPSITSFFNIITYVINGPSINKPIENNSIINNSEMCISAINKAVSPIERFADYHLHTHSRKSLIKLLVNKHANNSNFENHMIICKISQESNIQSGKGIIEILSNDKIFNKIKGNHNHIPHVYHEYLQTKNKNSNSNNIIAILLSKNIFSKTKDHHKQISPIGYEYLQKNKNFLDTWFTQVQEMSNVFVQNQIETQKSQALANQPFQYSNSKFSHEQKILNTFVEGQITVLETQAWINDVFKIFTK